MQALGTNTTLLIEMVCVTGVSLLKQVGLRLLTKCMLPPTFIKTLSLKKCINPYNNLYNNIKVTGIPFYANNLREKYPHDKKENIVVFPHRIAPEKNPEMFDKLALRFPEYKFVKTIDVTKTSEEYFELLAKSKIMVSFAQQETFGYSTVEGNGSG